MPFFFLEKSQQENLQLVFENYIVIFMYSCMKSFFLKKKIEQTQFSLIF